MDAPILDRVSQSAQYWQSAISVSLYEAATHYALQTIAETESV